MFGADDSCRSELSPARSLDPSAFEPVAVDACDTVASKAGEDVNAITLGNSSFKNLFFIESAGIIARKRPNSSLFPQFVQTVFMLCEPYNPMSL